MSSKQNTTRGEDRWNWSTAFTYVGKLIDGPQEKKENPAWLCKEQAISWGLSAYQNHIKNILEDPLYPLPQS